MLARGLFASAFGLLLATNFRSFPARAAGSAVPRPR